MDSFIKKMAETPPMKKFSQTWRQDAIAGLSVAVVTIPQSLAYAQLIGLPPVYGLYASLLPTLIAGLTASSPYIATGPTAIVSLLTATVIATPGLLSLSTVIVIAATLALMVGLLQIVFGLIKLGLLIRYIARPVVIGFVNAAAIIIAVSQIRVLLGVAPSDGFHFFREIASTIFYLDDIHPDTAMFGLFSLITMYFGSRFLKKVPWVLFVVVVTILVSYTTGFQGAIVGVIPTGLPRIGLSYIDPSLFSLLLVPALLIAFMGCIEGITVAKSVSGRTTRVRPNNEMISQGYANITAALSGTMPVAGSYSRTALTASTGARSKFTSVVVVLSVLAALFFASSFLRYLPRATLAAIIIIVVSRLVKVSVLRELIHDYPRDAVVAGATFVASFLFAPNLAYAVLVGVLVSILMLLYRNANPPSQVLYLNNPELYAAVDLHFDDYPSNARVAIAVWDGSITFVNAGAFEDLVLSVLSREPKISHVIVMGRGVNEIDTSGQETIESVYEQLRQSHITLVFSRLRRGPVKRLQESGLYHKIGDKYFFKRANDALAYIHEHSEKAT